ncbi:MAG: hypothetical protein QM699_03945 [Amaricoccus sp.]|uniref:hypothetical protein n=1 Tax=Amaricoccus sp. TaxID=1872485 RepID=UPI0039E3FE4C
MTMLRIAALLALAGFLGACTAPAGGASDVAPADPMTDSALSPDPMNPGQIDDSVGTSM